MTAIEKTIQDEMKMKMEALEAPVHPTRRLAAKAGRFLWHFVQMVIAMEAGMMVYHKLLWPLLSRTSYATFTDQYPLVGYWMMVVSMVLGMIALMCYHRSKWSYSLEMTLAMVAPLAMLTVMTLCNWLPAYYLYQVGDPVMFLAMAVYMLICPAPHVHGGQTQACHA